jgi:hypothetical protein
LVSGLNSRQEKIDSLSDLTLSNITATTVTTGGLTSGKISAYVPGDSNTLVVGEFGTDASVIRLNGAFIDSYRQPDGQGRVLYLNYLNGNGSVQVGSKLAIGTPPSNFQFSCAGAGSFTSFVEATKFQITSDERIKTNVQPASLDECTRLMLTVRPVTYRLKSTDEAQLGYLANDWDRQVQDGYRCVMGESEDSEGKKLLALDMMRIIPILHGSLLSALARIEALENRLT